MPSIADQITTEDRDVNLLYNEIHGAAGAPGITVNSLTASGKPWFDVTHPRFGAKGNGTTDDTTAIKTAISAAASNHSTVYFPAGTYKFTSQLNAANVRLVGAGVGATTLNCTAALGTGVPAIILSSDLTGIQKRSASATGFLLIGPGSYSLGNKVAACDGIRIDGPLLLTDLSVRFFDSGLIFNSAVGHSTLRSVDAANNYYGVYQLNEGGDYCLDDCDLTGNNWASIGIPGNPTQIGSGGWQGNSITRTHLGFSPYGLYQEAGTSTTFVYDSSFYDCRFEAIGNSGMFTEQFSTTVSGQFAGNHFYMPAATLNSLYKIAARPQDYFVKVGYAASSNYLFFGNAPWPSGSSSWLYVNESYGIWYIMSGPRPTPVPVVGSGHGDFFSYLASDSAEFAGTPITLKGLAQTAASGAVAGAGLNLPHGVAPTSPVNGDVWTTTAGLFVRVNGVTKTVTLT